MPSASLESSMQIPAQMENNDATKTVLNLLEKKVRNLEKRKGKLDFYKKLVDSGEPLNDDQKLAVGQLNQVEQNLEFARDLQKNIAQVYLDHQKVQKKNAKRDQAAQLAAQREGDISKVCQVLELQSLMDNLSEDVRADFLNGTNGAVVVSEENFVQIDEFYKLITPNPDDDKPIKEQQLSASQHIVKFLEASSESVVETTYKALNELVASIKKCDYFEQPNGDEEEEEEEEAAAEDENDKAEEQEGSGDDNAQPTETAETTNGATETHFNGGNTAASDAKIEGNVATFASNEHGLNFLSESEVESKPQAAVEPPAPVENLSERAPPESSGFGTQRADEGWVEQGGEAAAGDQGDNTGGFDTVHHSNGFSRGGRGGRGGYRRGDGYNRRGGPPGERGNRRGGRGGYGPPRGGRGGFGQQQDNYQRRGNRGGPRGGRGGDRGGQRGRGPPQQ